MIGINEFSDAVLGAVLCNHDENWNQIKKYFIPEAFGSVDKIEIASAIAKVSETGSFSLPVVLAELGGKHTLLVTNIFSNGVTGMNISWMCKQLHDWHMATKAIGVIASEIPNVLNGNINASVTPSFTKIRKVVEDLENGVDSLSSHKTTREILDSWSKRLESKLAGDESVGIKCGLPKLDEAISGLRGGRFYIIAARPSVGKTSFASFIAFNAMKQDKSVLFFSNEMDSEDIMDKFISMDAKIPNSSLNGSMSESELGRLSESVNKIQNMKIIVDEKSGWNLDSLISSAHQHVSKKTCDLIIIDYMQQVKISGNASKYEQASAVSDALKKLSRDLNIPVIGLAQINREAEKTDQAPSLVHIKDSGSFEQDADVVIILHREKLDPGNTYTPIDMRIAKNRYGKVGDVKLKFFHAYSHYAEIT